MRSRTKDTRAPREAPPPSVWGKSVTGIYFRVVLQKQRDRHGRKLYRLYFLDAGVKGNYLWTLAELEDAHVHWLKRRPSLRHQK